MNPNAAEPTPPGDTQTPTNQVFGSFLGLTVESGDEGVVVLRQGANVICFPPELASNVTFAIGQAERGDR